MEAAIVDERRSSRFLIVLLAFLAIASAFVIWPFLTGTLFALVLGFLLQRPYKALLRVVRWKPLAAALILLVVLIVVVAPLVFVSWKLFQDATALVRDMDAGGGFEATLIDMMVGAGVPPDRAADLLAQGLAKAGEMAQGVLLAGLGRLVSAAANIGVFFFLLYFMLTEGERLLHFARQAMPLAPDRSAHLFQTVGGTVRALFLGTFLVAGIQGVVATLGWWLFGLPNIAFWGFVMTLLAVIPAVGPSIIMVPAGVILILQGHTLAGIGVIVYALVVVGLVDNFTRPFIVGRSSDVHPGIVLLGTVGGLALFGLTGFIIGPLVLSLIKPVIQEWEALRPGPG